MSLESAADYRVAMLNDGSVQMKSWTADNRVKFWMGQPVQSSRYFTFLSSKKVTLSTFHNTYMIGIAEDRALGATEDNIGAAGYPGALDFASKMDGPDWFDFLPCEWRQWEIQSVGSAKVRFKNIAHGTYLAHRMETVTIPTDPLKAMEKISILDDLGLTLSDAEEEALVHTGPPGYAILDINKVYLDDSATKYTEWELIRVGDGLVEIKSVESGRYLSARGNGKFTATTTHSSWCKFRYVSMSAIQYNLPEFLFSTLFSLNSGSIPPWVAKRNHGLRLRTPMNQIRLLSAAPRGPTCRPPIPQLPVQELTVTGLI